MILSPISGINRITQKFGLRPEVYAQFGMKGHNGIDLTPKNKNDLATIYAPIEGIVTVAQDDGATGYGKHVKIRSTSPDAKGRIKEVVLGHLSGFSVKVGQLVYLLDEIGIEGNTGFSSGPHVHFGLRFIDNKGNVIDANNGYKGYIDFIDFLRFWTAPKETQAYGVIV